MPSRRLFALSLLLWPAALWAAKPIPPAPPSYVHNEGVVSPEAEARLAQTLRGFEQATGHQFAVALFQSLDGEALEDYSNRLFRAWKIGDAKRNDGLLFCLFQQDRKWRVEVGYGLEGTLTDLQAGAIAREQAVPYFKNGDFDGGVQAVVEGLSARLQGQPLPARADKGGRSDLIIIIFFGVLLAILSWVRQMAFGGYCVGRRSGGYCRGGFFPGGGWSGGSGGFGGFSGGGGSSGGGGASGGW